MTTPPSALSLARVPVFSLGLRPFFPLAALYGAVVVALWVPWYLGVLSLPSTLPPTAWHAHELLFGFMPAILAGFLLTAIPSWTHRPPLTGWPLAALVGLWLLGRGAIAFGGILGPTLAAPLLVALGTLAFPVVLTALAARDIIAARNHRNLKVVGCLGMLFAAQVLFQWEWATQGWSPYGESLAIAALVGLILIVGGRIVPNFTANWVRTANPGPLPAPTGRIDRVASGLAALALAGWVLRPAVEDIAGMTTALAVLLALGGLATAVRQARWVPHRTGGEPLVAILHIAHALVPLGFLMAAVAVAWPAAGLDSAAIHTWTAGAIPLMSLAVMTRAARGHTGHPLTAPPATVALYGAIVAAMLARVLAVFVPSLAMTLLPLAASAWVAGLLGYVALYGPMLARPRRPSKA